MTDLPNVKPLAEQSVLILGGSSGIGLACAEAFAGAGATVRIAGRSAERGQAAAAGLGPNGGFLACDAADPAEVTGLIGKAVSEMGALDTLVCSTGGARLPELLFKWSLDDIQTALLQDLAPFLYAGRAALDPMMRQGQGCIVNIASDAGKLATPGEAVIGAGMAAIIQFTRGLAIEAKRNGIRANTLTPSLVEGTALTERLMEEGRFSAKLFAKARPQAHLGPTEPADLAAMALFLASPQGARITGQAISINGGISAA